MKVIVAGGTGRVGTELCKQLLSKGMEVIILSRKAKNSNTPGVSYSEWHPATGKVGDDIFREADAIINLSGASIAQRWTSSARKEIIDSRIQTTSLLSEKAQLLGSTIKTFINASAIGYYEPGDDWKEEDAPAGKHFMADVCSQWEEAVTIPPSSEIRKVIFRIGVVLEEGGGALKAMSLPFKFGLGAALGSGMQYMSVVHLEDLVGMMLFALENEGVKGVYNATMTELPTNQEFSKSLAKALKRPFFLPAVPAFLLRLALGETAESVLLSFRVDNEKIRKAGYTIKYPSTEKALEEIYR